jgi:hypothetical protein
MKWSTAFVFAACVVGVVTLALMPGNVDPIRYVAGGTIGVVLILVVLA